MRNVVIAGASALALLAGTSLGNAQILTAPDRDRDRVIHKQFEEQEITQSDIKFAQEQLKAAGLFNGLIDGSMGPETKRGLVQFQQQRGLSVTGELDRDTLKMMGRSRRDRDTATTPPNSATTGPTTRMPGTPGVKEKE